LLLNSKLLFKENIMTENMPVTQKTRALAPSEKMRQATSTPYVLEKIERVLGKGKNAEMFIASIMDIYTSDKMLMTYDPNLVIAECFKAAVLNLPLNKGLGFAYVVPYNGRPTFQVGYKGYIQLAMRTGQYQRLNDGIVYKGAKIHTDQLSGDVEISDNEINEEPVGYFAYFRLKNGFEKCVYMTKEAAAAHGKKYSKSYAKDSSPWKLQFDAMAVKTCWRRLLSKYGIMSVEMIDVMTNSDEDATPAKDAMAWDTAENANQGEIIDLETGEITGGKEEGSTPAPSSFGPPAGVFTGGPGF